MSSQPELRLIILLTEDQSSSLLIFNYKVYLDSFIRVILKKKEMAEWQNYDEKNFLELWEILRHRKYINIIQNMVLKPPASQLPGRLISSSVF